MTLSRSDRSHLLAKIDGLVTAKYYDPAFNGHNWMQIVDQNREAILNADSNLAFEGAVNEMLGEMRSTGLGLLGPETRIAPRNSINASFCAVETLEEGRRWVFQDVLPGGVADRAGIKPGDALIEISGVDTKPPRTPEFLMNAKTSIVVSKTGSRRDIEVDLTTQRPKYKDNPYSEPRSAAAQMREGIAAVLKIGLFPGLIGIDFANAITALFSSKLKNARSLGHRPSWQSWRRHRGFAHYELSHSGASTDRLQRRSGCRGAWVRPSLAAPSEPHPPLEA